ncbi:hypothetical protein OJ997_30950 [Solirubrobacter phytolaccae]|uniref:Uncharacterized protein n=1 Tax=Solirubrobacter phytolaccae TaxID=1404360 RepID=A0A9X3SCJ3_9ACTN|nr:hypothetical protein [Solirubrobacter phytolaccae]MDA0184761.1 hypothetical protein [Solirubrobacter phytolaccae]
MNQAVRASAGGPVDAEAIAARARELGVLGWVRPTGELHAEGAPDAVAAVVALLGEDVAGEHVKVEGHEQFGIRGVPAGPFVVEETAKGFVLRLEVDGVMRCWTLAKAPSMDPAVKRMAFEGDAEGVGVWDQGRYEQGGRVAWPEALERGHAVFVLHGSELQGGFALQRIRPRQWLLIKRKDAEARGPA